MNFWFERLIDLTAIPADKGEVRCHLARLTKESEFEWYSYVRLRGEVVDYVSNLPQEWCSTYMRMRYTTNEPAIINARRSRVISAWTITKDDRSLPRTVRRMRNDAYEIGIRAGITVPVAIGFGHCALFSLCSRSETQVDISKTDPALAASAVAQLHVLLSGSDASETGLRLKAREARCLRWIAEGKSMSVVADLEGLSYGGARFFLQNAKTALGAVSLPQATAVAKELKLI